MTRFRPCIDLHAGSVKQIVGGTLNTTTPDELKTNWTSSHPSAFYADLYKKHDLTGAHVIMLGPGNDQAAQEALEAWKGGMQVGGGITEQNAAEWIAKGADKVSGICVIGPRNEGLSIDPEANGSAVGDYNILPFSLINLLHGSPESRAEGPR